MKPTSFEISKKLREIGFSKTPDDHHILDGVFYPCWSLETILEALPKNYLIKNDWLECFQNGSFNGTKRLEDESLADTAARLLILLVEKGIINLKE